MLTRLLPAWASKYNHSFKDAFRELAAVYGPLQDVPLASAELILDGEAKRTGDTFEAAGLKIPADLAVRCGVLLILGVQLYMLIHLREFGSRLDRNPGFEVAWIGVYTSQLARAMLFASLLLLPACTVILLSVRGFQMTESRWLGWTIAVGSNVASILLSTLIFRALPDQPEPPARPPQSPKDREVSESLTV